jgi:hypothetical protein
VVAADLRRAIQRVEESLRLRGYSEISHLVEFFGVAHPGNQRAAVAPLPARGRN